MEGAPSARLAPWVACVWTMDGAGELARQHRVLPDGCVDVIADRLTGQTYVVGAMTTAIVVPLVPRASLCGIRFLPGAALSFLDTPIHELTDRRVSLGGLRGSRSIDLADALLGRPSPIVLDDLVTRLGGRVAMPRHSERLATSAISLLRRSRGRGSIRDVGAALGVGERRLERAFDQCVGLNPKAFARMLRFRRALRSMGSHDAPALAAVALDAGYADQAHFAREFKALAGITPSAYAVERRVGFVQDEGCVAD